MSGPSQIGLTPSSRDEFRKAIARSSFYRYAIPCCCCCCCCSGTIAVVSRSAAASRFPPSMLCTLSGVCTAFACSVAAVSLLSLCTGLCLLGLAGVPPSGVCDIFIKGDQRSEKLRGTGQESPFRNQPAIGVTCRLPGDPSTAWLSSGDRGT